MRMRSEAVTAPKHAALQQMPEPEFLSSTQSNCATTVTKKFIGELTRLQKLMCLQRRSGFKMSWTMHADVHVQP